MYAFDSIVLSVFEVFLWDVAFVSSVLFCEEKKSSRASALSLTSDIISPSLRRGGMLLDCEGLITPPILRS